MHKPHHYISFYRLRIFKHFDTKRHSNDGGPIIWPQVKLFGSKRNYMAASQIKKMQFKLFGCKFLLIKIKSSHKSER